MVESDKEFLIVGLGNPGKEYENTRHNLGDIVVRAFASQRGWTFKDEKRFQGLVARGQIGDVKVHLLLPTTYMNESGRSVRKYINFYRFRTGQVIVATDDVDLPYGQLRLRESGSAGGHNGLKSIQQHLGTQHYTRLRLGVGQKNEGQEMTSHVLGRFSAEEKQQLPEILQQGTEVLLRLLKEEVPRVMNDVNRKLNKKRDPEQQGRETKDEQRETKPL
ncbi:MAG: aminoacyl-tRNA hydrolase [Chlamydiales bacterium]|nr:aminoacyl-tRNA hydrolase [Chlamydiia bacterium]MCP5508312.1 aminoacyl-tRNA hydrolase [Chlamydiales bacterium]